MIEISAMITKLNWLRFIASEMQKEGLDVNNEENLDSYLNMKFM
jgi:hypothetical protein